jgi:hypothetical protein
MTLISFGTDNRVVGPSAPAILRYLRHAHGIGGFALRCSALASVPLARAASIDGWKACDLELCPHR